VGTTPSQSVESVVLPALAPPPAAKHAVFLEQLWFASSAETWDLTRGEFIDILLRLGSSQNYGLSPDLIPTPEQEAAYFRTLRLDDLVLARACANGNERAWEHFLALYHQPLIRAAVAITGSDTQGRDMADALYAELYGLTTRDGERRCPLETYKGRGSLLGWLRTTLAQRHVDHHRHTHRETPLDEYLHDKDVAAKESAREERPAELTRLVQAIETAGAQLRPEDRFLLAAYYLDERTLHQIGQVLHVHEATVSRKLRRLLDDMRKQVLRNLQDLGLSKRAAQEALGADPRDLDVNLKKLLQTSQTKAFSEKAGL
jgi:RNA polymerase sigma-70 factor, ECF subfamily